ncbi:helix-turn-helix transcriptional regulator [Brevibacillus sp. TJ4]|uniref:helix-turn-helix transcriptional regulator n=1 Tax=Brevibacillus sp. TJ4 TaxID=3234853 RepID=UPI003BA226D7
MSKSKRLIELMMAVNRMRKFTVKQLAQQFGVSSRTILRDLQELSELGVPLYSEVGPHGGYQVLRERILPPIAFTEEEAVSLFFASHSLRHYPSLPFETESSNALRKFYNYMPGDVRDRIDQMKNRVDFVAPTRQQELPYLPLLLDAAIRQRVVRIEYDSRGGVSSRLVQPVGIYAKNGFWYCPAYCFRTDDFRLFRCDRIVAAAPDDSVEPRDHQHIHLDNWESYSTKPRVYVRYYVELTKAGMQRCEAELCPMPTLYRREDGSGWLDTDMPESEIPYFAKFFIGLGNEATVVEPPELIDQMKQLLRDILGKYG